MKRITVCFFILAFFLLSVTACTAEVSYPDGYVGDVLSHSKVQTLLTSE